MSASALCSPFELGQDGLYRCSAFAQFPWQRHGFGTRAANPTVHMTLRQIHSDIVRNARGLEDREAEGDALVTDEIGRAIGVRTADCVPILLLDRGKRAISAVHAGWRGTAAGIVPRAIRTLQTELCSDVDDIFAAIGPCIRQCCYEVGPEVAKRFADRFTTQSSQPGKWRLDLAAANLTQMIDTGISPDRVFDFGACTACRADDFFSFRREPGDPGRMISSIQRLA